MYVVVTCVPDFSSSLHIRCRIHFEVNHRYRSLLFELPHQMKVQKAGFQIREDEALLEEGGRSSVRNWYTSPGLPKFVSYSMSNTHRSQSSISKPAF